jgi:hypothetical protein
MRASGFAVRVRALGVHRNAASSERADGSAGSAAAFERGAAAGTWSRAGLGCGERSACAQCAGLCVSARPQSERAACSRVVAQSDRRRKLRRELE